MKIFISLIIAIFTSVLVAEEGKEKSFAQFYHTKVGKMIMNIETPCCTPNASRCNTQRVLVIGEN